jgi:hypothetical protein
MRLFGFGPNPLVEALREQITFLREQLAREQVARQEDNERHEAVNDKLREELLTLTAQGAQAQLEAYRERRKMKPPEEPAPKPTPTEDMTWMGDYFADGVVPESMQPSEEEIKLETQRRYREELRLKGVSLEDLPAPSDPTLAQREEVPA